MKDPTRRMSQYRIRIGVAALALGYLVPGVAAERSSSMSSDAVAREAFGRLRSYLFDNLPIEKPAFDAAVRVDAQPAAFVGREDLAAASADSLPACVALGADPIELIVQRARRTNIVVINENHGSPLDRHFVGKVLMALRREGYSIYAAEAFSPSQNLNHADVLGFDGWYSNEPIFGRTIRLAKSLGYAFASYEQTREQFDKAQGNAADASASSGAPSQLVMRRQIEAREDNQARNLFASIFKDRPDARVVIHVGFSHARERTAPIALRDGNVWMAERLKALTGRDPLTISQLDCKSSSARDVIAEARLAADGTVKEGSAVDLYVGHASLDLKSGRPTWRQTAGDKAFEVPADFSGLSERVMVEARPAGAELGTVPVDRVLIFPKEELPLLLPPGRYRIDAFTAGGQVARSLVMVEVR